MSETYEFDLVAIGSGPAGQRAAVQAAKLGKRAAVIEKNRYVGGVCVETGTIPSKTFREAVWAMSEAPAAGARPTAAELLARVSDVVRREIKVVDDQLRRNDVTVIRGEAAFQDPHTLLVRSESGFRVVRTGTVVVAVGTRAVLPPGAVIDGEIAITSDDIVHLKRLPRAMTVVGAGVIGIEYASMFAALGVEVTLVERRPRPLDFVDREIVDELIHQMRNGDVTFRFGETVERFEVAEGPPRRGVLLLESGKRIVSDLVLFSVGRTGATGGARTSLRPDSRPTIAGRLGVDANVPDRGPAHLRRRRRDRVSEPRRDLQRAGTAGGLPRLRPRRRAHGAALPRSGIYSIPEISMVGATEQELTAEKVPYETGIARYREIARGQILGDDSGLFKMLFHRDDRRLLGAHAIGTGATELIHIGQAVLGLGGGLDYFMRTVFNYPTLAECYKVAALDAANKLAT